MERLIYIFQKIIAAKTAYAETLFDDPTGSTVFSKPQDVTNFITRVETIIVEVAGAIGVVMIVWGATLFLTAGGNEEKLKKGKDVLKWAILGLILVIASHALVVMLVKVLGGKVG